MEDHDLGLAHDLPQLLGRRRVLQLIGAAGAVVLVGCGGDDDASTATTTGSSTTSASSTTSDMAARPTGETTAAAASCAQIPEETAGPYPGDGSNGPNALAESGVVRSDIRSSFGSSSTVAEGVPVTVNLTLLDLTSGCSPLAGAAVYLWHCDREGRYSMYSEGVEDENYLRGVQESDADGVVTFQTIFPAAYSGRWPHIHFEVYESLEAATGGGTLNAHVAGRPARGRVRGGVRHGGLRAERENLAQTSLATDNVFSDDGGVSQLATVTGDVTSGYVINLSVSVDPTAESTGGGGGRQAAADLRRPRDAYTGSSPWTQTGIDIGMMPDSQMKSMACTVTRTQPCDAG